MSIYRNAGDGLPFVCTKSSRDIDVAAGSFDMDMLPSPLAVN
jgi:hypothetical protein